MTGIFKIVNKIDGKVYVGSSVNTRNWLKGFYCQYKFYSSPLYDAVKQYGIENFQFEILEECKKEQLREHKKYWMDLLDSTNKDKGYNYTRKNSYRLNEQELEFVRNELKAGTRDFEIAKKLNYKISSSKIQAINTGKTHFDPNIDYPIQPRKSVQGEQSPLAKFTDEQVMTLRTEYARGNVTAKYLYEKYSKEWNVSKRALKHILQGTRWKHLPIYKKKLHKWI